MKAWVAYVDSDGDVVISDTAGPVSNGVRFRKTGTWEAIATSSVSQLHAIKLAFDAVSSGSVEPKREPTRLFCVMRHGQIDAVFKTREFAEEWFALDEFASEYAIEEHEVLP